MTRRHRSAFAYGIQHVTLIAYDSAILSRFVDEHITPEFDRHRELVPDDGRQNCQHLTAVRVENDVRYAESDEQPERPGRGRLPPVCSFIIGQTGSSGGKSKIRN